VGSMAHPGFVSLQPENGRFPIQLLQEGVFLAPCGGGWPILTCGTGAPLQFNPDRRRLDSDSVTEEISKCYGTSDAIARALVGVDRLNTLGPYRTAAKTKEAQRFPDEGPASGCNFCYAGLLPLWCKLYPHEAREEFRTEPIELEHRVDAKPLRDGCEDFFH
jgi:hypothetical protein